MNLKGTRPSLCSLLFLFVAGGSAAAPDGGLERSFIPPELIMRHQTALQLSEEQRERIKTAITDMQGVVTRLEWDLQEVTQRMAGLIHETRVDEEAAMGHLDDLLNLENQMKRAHLTLFIRLKNELTPEQQKKLYHLKERMHRQGERDALMERMHRQGERDAHEARQKRLEKHEG